MRIGSGRTKEEERERKESAMNPDKYVYIPLSLTFDTYPKDHILDIDMDTDMEMDTKDGRERRTRGVRLTSFDPPCYSYRGRFGHRLCP